MITWPEVAILVSTYERPQHLARALLSIGLQQGVQEKMEVVVTDDGSTDQTRQVVEQFAETVDFPVRFTTHPHRGFRLARCRNEGLAASTAPYLLFLDGDCVMPPEHVAWHLKFRLPGTVVAGDCYRLDRETSERIAESTIRSGEYLRWIPRQERKRIANKALRARFYQLIRHPMRPRLTGNNIAVWRDDYERVNGFDEAYVGWGLEDRDFQHRLSRLGVRFVSILSHTATCHLWHPPDPTFARNNEGTANLYYYRHRRASLRCHNGLAKEDPSHPAIHDEMTILF